MAFVKETLPARAGIGLKGEHYRAALACADDGFWLEVHPENYMVQGGPRLAWLEAIRVQHPLSFHGVGASLGGPDPLDPQHMMQLKHLVQRFEPASISEHVAWSAASGQYFADLLPLPSTANVLELLADRIDAFQTCIGRSILVENPSVYVDLRSEMDEPDFLTELCRRTGCRVLLDINNVYVSARNTSFDAQRYIDAVPAHLIGEIHLAGHEPDAALGDALLIDTHGCAIAEPVWGLYRRLVARIGPRPVLIERDTNIPSFETLMVERHRADMALMPARVCA
jgi:uncharacterized protein (UPF0276 family)